MIDGLRSLWYWLPVIWRDRWWDHSFFIRLVEHKLRQMEREFRGRPRFPDHPKKARRINYCRILATRIRKSGYLERALKHHEEIYGMATILTEPIGGGYSRLTEIAVPQLVGRRREVEKARRFRLYREADRQETQDYDELFRLLRKYIRYWWD